MKEFFRAAILVMAGTAPLAPTAALATTPFSAQTRLCMTQIENNTALLAKAVNDQIRNSIHRNLAGADSACSGGFVCNGGLNPDAPCVSNGVCGSVLGVPWECGPKETSGIANLINKAKAKLRAKITQFCSGADLMALYGGLAGSARCPDPDSPDDGLDATELASCIIDGTIGRVAGAGLSGSVGELLAYGAPGVAVDDPAPNAICGVTLGSRLDVGIFSGGPVETDVVGKIAPLLPVGCSAGVPFCQTEGATIVGNQTKAPAQTYAGVVPICLVTRAADVGNGTTQDGSIDLSTGEQHSTTVESVTLFYGTTCPSCDLNGICQGGSAHDGLPCNRKGDTDVACPPFVIGTEPVILLPVERSTESHTLTIPSGPGVFNPASAFCGACDGDQSVACRSDSECTLQGVCFGGPGCCTFAGAPGALGVSSATVVTANGVRGPFMPQLAAAACVGKTQDPLTDAVLGLPGPMRSLSLQLNTFQY